MEFTLRAIFFSFIIYYSLGQGTSVCNSTVQYNYESGNGSCTSNVGCISYDCKIQASSVSSVNFTLSCFNVTRIEIHGNVSGIVAIHINNENETFNISSIGEVNFSYQCVMEMQMSFAEMQSMIDIINFFSVSSIETMTSPEIKPTSTTTKPTSSSPTKPAENSSSSPDKPTTNSSSDTAKPTMNSSPNQSPTNASTSTSSSTPDDNIPSTGNDNSAIVGAVITIGILLLLIMLAIMVLICVLVCKKRKGPVLNLSEFSAAENDYSYVNNQVTSSPPESNIGVLSIGQNFFPGVGAVIERTPHNLSELSLPVPPLEPELVPLEVWKQENDCLPVYNSHYASTAAATGGNMSEPPDYESIQDVRKNYTLSGGGNLELLHPRHGLHNESSWASYADRSGVKEDITRVDKMALLQEEDRCFDEESLTFTAENNVYESEEESFGYTAENFLYQSQEQAASGHKPAVHSSAISCELEAADIDQNVNNQLYEAVQREHSPSPMLHPLDEKNIIHSDPEQVQRVPKPEHAPSKFPDYSKVNLAKKHRKRMSSSPCTDSDDNTDDPPCIPPYHPNHNDTTSPPHTTLHNSQDLADFGQEAKGLPIESGDTSSVPLRSAAVEDDVLF